MFSYCRNMCKEDLNVGKKKDQDFYEMFLREYNDGSVQEYGESAFPLVWTLADLQYPDKFDKFGSWHDMKTHFHDLLNMYFEIKCNMEKSGNHDDGEEVEIANFTKSTLMQYFHTFLDDPKNAGVFEKAHGDLQDDVRFEIGQRKIENKRKSKR